MTITCPTSYSAVRRADAPGEIGGLQLAVRVLRGRAGDGDFFEVLPLTRGRWGLAVGDMHADRRGHSPASQGSAGRNLVVPRAVLRATARIEPHPKLVLAALNRALLAYPPHSHYLLGATFATVRSGRLGAVVRLCTAGRHQAFVRRTAGSVLPLPAQGTPLGLRAHPELRETRLLMRPGDSLILVTDLVTEAFSEAGRLSSGAERFCPILADLGSASAARSADAILRAVREARGGRIEHETVALVLKSPGGRRGSGQHAAEWPGTHHYEVVSQQAGRHSPARALAADPASPPTPIQVQSEAGGRIAA